MILVFSTVVIVTAPTVEAAGRRRWGAGLGGTPDQYDTTCHTLGGFINCDTTYTPGRPPLADELTAMALERQQQAAQPQVVYVVPQAQPPQPFNASNAYMQLMTLIQAGAKYCPVDLAIFPWNSSTCPIHHVSLRTVKSLAQEKGLIPPDQPSISNASVQGPPRSGTGSMSSAVTSSANIPPQSVKANKRKTTTLVKLVFGLALGAGVVLLWLWLVKSAAGLKMNLYLKAFLRAGIPFGIVMGVLYSFEVGLTRGVIGGILSGLFYGVFMSAILVTQHKRAVK